MNRSGVKGRTINLYARFFDIYGDPINTDDTPFVELFDPNGNTVLSSTDTYTTQITDELGVYRFSYELPLTLSDGYHTDYWTAEVGGEPVEFGFTFLVIDGGTVAESIEPVYSPDSDFPYVFTKCESEGISYLMKILKKRLKNDGFARVDDGMGGFTQEPCPVFSDAELICFLINGLSEFNAYPHFTNFTFCDDAITGIFADIIIQGAFLLAVAAQSLIEKGREFVINDNGVTYQPPAISEILTTQYNAQLADYKEKLKIIKCNIKPSILGLGTFRVTAISPNFLRLRHLRQRQIL